jgi:hypothetical protein
MVATDDAWAAGGHVLVHWDGSAWDLTAPPPGDVDVNAIDMLSADAGWAVGYSASGSGILAWDGETWSQFSGPQTPSLASVDIVSADDVWAVGNEGTIVHFDGDVWNEVPSPTDAWLKSVSLTGPNDGWAVGLIFSPPGGVLLRWDGSSWTEHGQYSGSPLLGVSMRSATDGWAVGTGGAMLHWDGAAWTDDNAPLAQTLNAVAVSGAGPGAEATWSVGDGGAILDRQAGTWRLVEGADGTRINGLTLHAPDDGWAVGDIGSLGSSRGAMLRWDGQQWEDYPIPETDGLLDVSMTSSVDGWAVGHGGAILQWDGAEWTAVENDWMLSLNGVAAVSPTDAWAVGMVGGILHWDGLTWTVYDSPTTSTLEAIFMLDADDGWAVGSLGTTVHWDGLEWTVVESPTNTSLHGVSFAAADDGWAVGWPSSTTHSVAALHWDGEAWTAGTTPGDFLLQSVAMSPDGHAWAVGNGGDVLDWDGASWTRSYSGTDQALYAVALTAPDEGWIGGTSRTFLRLGGEPSQPTSTPTTPSSTATPTQATPATPTTPTTPQAAAVYVPATYKNWGAHWPGPIPTAPTQVGTATPTASPPVDTATPTASPTAPSPSPSPTAVAPVEIVEQVGGAAYAAAVGGDHVLVGRGNRLVVYDASDPAAPVEIGRTAPLSGVVQDVIAQGSVAYVLAVAGDRLNIDGVTSAVHAVSLDLLTQPTVLSSVHLPGVAFEAAMSDDRLYVPAFGFVGADLETNLHVLDIGLPGSMLETARVSIDVAALGITLRDSHAYLVGQDADGNGVLRVVDLSTADEPQIVGALTVGRGAAATVCAIHGDYLYVADDWSLYVVDVSAPDKPEHVVNYWEWADYWDVAGTYDLGFVGEHLAVLDYNRLKLLRPYDPEWKPGEGETALIGEAEFDVRTDDLTHALAIYGSRVVVAGGFTGGHALVSAAEPQAPDLLSTTIDVGDVVCGAVTDSAYAALTGQGVRVIDLAGSQPEPRGVLELDTRWWRCSAAAAGDTAYFVGGPFVIADVSNHNAPKALYQVSENSEWSATDLEIVGHALYLATEQGGLRTANVSNPGRPTLGETLPGCDNAVAVAREEGILAAANGPDGVALFDVSQPLNPRQLATLSVDGVTVDVALAGDVAYALVLRGEGGGLTDAYIAEIDITQPESPVTGRIVKLDMFATRLWRALDYTIAASLQHMLLLDSDLGPAGTLMLPELPRSLSETATAAHIATGPGGLQILERRQ